METLTLTYNQLWLFFIVPVVIGIVAWSVGLVIGLLILKGIREEITGIRVELNKSRHALFVIAKRLGLPVRVLPITIKGVEKKGEGGGGQ